MVTKTLTITKEAYDLLIQNKLKDESFSKEIVRLLSVKKAKKIIEFLGIISSEEGEEIIKELERSKDLEKKKAAKRAEVIWGDEK
jgi:predicted CopG family antitoxin